MKYTALMLLIIALACGCKHEPNPSLTSLHTKKLAKTWEWEVTEYRSAGPNQTTITLPDTLMAINVVNNETISIGGIKFTYNKNSDSLKKLQYSTDYLPPYTVDYFYNEDRVVYTMHTATISNSYRVIYSSK